MRPSPLSRRLAVLSAAIALAASIPVRAQLPGAAAQRPCSLTWIGHESAVEQSLFASPVLRLEDVPIGVTKPRRAVFDTAGLVARAAWKPLPPAMRSGYRESYKAEIAAYLLDRLIGLHMVPPVVERRVSGQVGAMVFWVDNTRMWDTKEPPKGPEPEWSRQVSRMKLFDLLVANIDRNAGNLLYDDDWHLILIDHSRAFTERRDLRNLAQPAFVDRALWSRIDALTMESLQPLAAMLSQGEMRALLSRRDQMRTMIQRMVKERGEGSVFF